MFFFLTYFGYNIFIMVVDASSWHPDIQLTVQWISGLFNIIQFIFYMALTAYFLYLSEQYYRILFYSRLMIFTQRLFYFFIAAVFALSCVDIFLLQALVQLQGQFSDSEGNTVSNNITELTY